MTDLSLLKPAVIVLLPRFSEAVPVIADVVMPRFPECPAIALSSSKDESANYARAWRHREGIPLLILREAADNHIRLAAEAVMAIRHFRRSEPLGLILGDGPEASNFDSLRRNDWNRNLGRILASEFRDLQIVEYSASWRYSPPRIR